MSQSQISILLVLVRQLCPLLEWKEVRNSEQRGGQHSCQRRTEHQDPELLRAAECEANERHCEVSDIAQTALEAEQQQQAAIAAGYFSSSLLHQLPMFYTQTV